jgi:hypothetical protein
MDFIVTDLLGSQLEELDRVRRGREGRTREEKGGEEERGGSLGGTKEREGRGERNG